MVSLGTSSRTKRIRSAGPARRPAGLRCGCGRTDAAAVCEVALFSLVQARDGAGPLGDVPAVNGAGPGPGRGEGASRARPCQAAPGRGPRAAAGGPIDIISNNIIFFLSVNSLPDSVNLVSSKSKMTTGYW